ncbi:glycosyltransferase [Flavobacterium piscis]|uniref:Glycosyltransferase involved in cell wall biosynthesis n=1 Tax=Flavobacterium piscis TaxID=1114874 RepID=A0ABU1Y484_9FLAO|nr:glycosyltransferase [Flavobacterium piscis]MDR7208963.1 glycosyltransferase involved in cell wall biosynthesis [Flavobacterium piscis]
MKTENLSSIQNNFYNNQDVTLSIIVTCFNYEKFIAQAIDSFLMQKTNFKVEILINDDASKDRSVSILKEYERKFPNLFRIFYQKENQYSKGIKPWFDILFPEAKGKYIALCEGDDYWTDPYKLQKQVDFLKNNPEFSMSFHDAFVVKNDVKLYKYVSKNKSVFTIEDLFEKHFIPTASIVFKNNLQIPDWYSKVQSGDKLLLFLLALKGNIKYLNEVMSVYRLHEGGISNTHFGIKKVYDSALLLNLVDMETNYKYNKNCHASLFYEIETHLSNKIKLSSEIEIKNIRIRLLINEIIRRLSKKIQFFFK